MNSIFVDREKCNKDGLCASECPTRIIVMDPKQGYPVATPDFGDFCLKCGHCVSICSKDALRLDWLVPEKCRPMKKEMAASPEQAEQFLCGRRSIRTFKEKKVPREILEKLLLVACSAPSAKNQQPWHWIVIQDRAEVRKIAGKYAFGSELLAAPYVTPRDEDTRLSRQVIWLPEGEWYDFYNGRYFPGNGWYALYGGLEEIPVIAKAGAIVPTGPMVGWGGVDNPEELILNIFPGSDNRFELFEDDGVSQGYLNGDYVITPFEQKWNENQVRFQVGPATGNTSHLPNPRNYTLVFRSISEPGRIRIAVNGKSREAASRYDPEKHSLTISDLSLTPADMLVIEVEAGSKPLAHRDEVIAGVVAKR